MKVFVTGATGVLGTHTVERLATRGHTVYGLARDERGERRVAHRGGTPVSGDIFEPSTYESEAAEADAVVHAATAIPTDTKPDADAWERNDRVRRDGAERLLEVIDPADLEVFVFPSVVWAYRDPEGAYIDESAPPNPDRTTRSAVETERRLEAAFGDSSVALSILRLGWLYGPRSGQTRRLAHGLVSGNVPVVGSGWLGRGETVVSLCHSVDAARAISTAIEERVGGTFHIVDEEPITTRELFSTFAMRLGADEPGWVPWWIARFVVGKDFVRFLTSDFPTSNDRFKAATDWEPAHPRFADGIDDVIGAWDAADVLTVRDGTLQFDLEE